MKNRRLIKKIKSNIFITGIGIVLFMVVFLYLWPRMKITETGYYYEELKKKHIELLQNNKKLRVEIASLLSPGRIEKIAREDLKMVFPKSGQLVIVSYKIGSVKR